MSHDHSHSVPGTGKRLAIVVTLNFIITITEIIGGLISGSLSLLSDALHNFSDGIVSDLDFSDCKTTLKLINVDLKQCDNLINQTKYHRLKPLLFHLPSQLQKHE